MSRWKQEGETTPPVEPKEEEAKVEEPPRH